MTCPKYRRAKPAAIDGFVRKWDTPQSMKRRHRRQSDPQAMEASALLVHTPLSQPREAANRSASSTVAADSVDYFKDKELGNNLYVWWKLIDQGLERRGEGKVELVSSIAVGSIQKRLGDLARRPETGILGLRHPGRLEPRAELRALLLLAPREGKAETAIAADLAELKRKPTSVLLRANSRWDGRLGRSNEAQPTKKIIRLTRPRPR